MVATDAIEIKHTSEQRWFAYAPGDWTLTNLIAACTALINEGAPPDVEIRLHAGRIAVYECGE